MRASLMTMTSVADLIEVLYASHIAKILAVVLRAQVQTVSSVGQHWG